MKKSKKIDVDFKRELTTLINRYNIEIGSNTPDFILANYLINCLHNFDSICNRRTEWYGYSDQIGVLNSELAYTVRP